MKAARSEPDDLMLSANSCMGALRSASAATLSARHPAARHARLTVVHVRPLAVPAAGQAVCC